MTAPILKKTALDDADDYDDDDDDDDDDDMIYDDSVLLGLTNVLYMCMDRILLQSPISAIRLSQPKKEVRWFPIMFTHRRSHADPLFVARIALLCCLVVRSS